MKIQVGPKGELAWDVVLDALKKEQLLEATDSPKKRWGISDVGRCVVRYIDHRLILLLLVGMCILSYFFMYWIADRMSTVYNHGANLVYESVDGKLYHIHFSWSNCGSDDDPMKLSRLQIKPDPVHLDRNITINLISSLGIDIDADHPISADVKIERHLGFVWVEIPCIEEIGSCFYPDVCKVIPFSPEEPCPDPFPRFNIPCHCPISHGIYNIKNGTFNLSVILDMFPLPHWLVSGDYYGKVISSRKNKRLGCYEVYASVKA